MEKRELKFRAWDTLKKMFVPQGEIIFIDYGDTRIEVNPNCMEYIGDACHNGEPQRSRFEIVQYIGLKDKNGTEIYEGDFVDLGSMIGIVQFNKGTFQIVNPHDELQGTSRFVELATSDGILPNYCIVGNKFQNPKT